MAILLPLIKDKLVHFMLENVEECCKFLKANGVGDAVFGIVLGTGLGQFIEEIEIEAEVDYSEIPHFPEATVEFHKGRIVYGSVSGQKVIAMQGRYHFYEGYSMQQITFPIRVLNAMGIKHLLLSNAAGSINADFKKGDLMLIDDHINLLPSNPLIGQNDDDWGPRFPDMSCPYDSDLNKTFKSIAQKAHITLHEGIYASVAGPNLETRAEYRYLHRIGADAVGMSTVPEVIVANHMGLPCAAISVLTDECDPDNLKPIDISEIIKIAGEAEPKMITLFKSLITKRSTILN